MCNFIFIETGANEEDDYDGVEDVELKEEDNYDGVEDVEVNEKAGKDEGSIENPPKPQNPKTPQVD